MAVSSKPRRPQTVFWKGSFKHKGNVFYLFTDGFELEDSHFGKICPQITALCVYVQIQGVSRNIRALHALAFANPYSLNFDWSAPAVNTCYTLLIDVYIIVIGLGGVQFGL